MNTEETLEKRTIIHRPYGEQHPYASLPNERYPRDPSIGEPVTLGIETSQSPCADALWCIWKVDGMDVVNRTPAIRVQSNSEADHWKVHLNEFASGVTVRYRFEAQFGDQLVNSEEFSFTVTSWVDVVGLAEVIENAKQLVVRLHTNIPELSIQLTARQEMAGTIRLRLAALSENCGEQNLPVDQLPIAARWDELTLTIETNPVRLKFSRDTDGLELRSIRPIQLLVGADNNVLQYRLGFESPTDEAFYGLGERYNAFNQRGNILDNHIYNQYLDQGKRTYIPIPFFLSSRGFGLWIDTDQQATFDFAGSELDSWKVIAPVEIDRRIDLWFFFQPHPRSTVQAFASLTGKPLLPPSWVFGLWMSANAWNSQAEVLRQLHLTQEHDIPATVMVVEAWSDETTFYIWNDARYQQKPSSHACDVDNFTFPEDGHWPDPKAMIGDLHKAGIRLVLWQIPVLKAVDPAEGYDVSQINADQEHAIQSRYVIQRADGSPHKVEAHAPWFVDSLVLDFSNPEAEDWWFRKREYLIADMGVDGFKTDGGEHIWDKETRFANGLRGDRGINLYPLMYLSAYNRFMKKYRGEDFVLFSRAGYTGAQKVSCHWTGDDRSTWAAYRSAILAMLNAGLCGFPFIGWDLAGFSGPIPSSELYLRAAAFSVFCPIMQYHSESNARQKPSRDRTPWNIQEQTGDQNVIPIFRKFANLRMNLIPYIITQARLSHETGLPLMRALSLEFPNDKKGREYPYEYLFGESLLVAPVVEEGKLTWPVYLPDGDWADFWTGQIIQGGREIFLEAPLDKIPVFVHKGSIVPLNLGGSLELSSPVGNSTEEVRNLAIVVFAKDSIHEEIYQGINKPALSVAAAQHGAGEIAIDIDRAEMDIDLLIIGEEPHQVSLDGIPIPHRESDGGEQDTHWRRSANGRFTQIHLDKKPGGRITIEK